MKEYEFKKESIDEMFHEVCEQCMDISSGILDGIMPIGSLSKMDIKITIGDNQIVIPNNADNVEVIFEAIKECFEQTE